MQFFLDLGGVRELSEGCIFFFSLKETAKLAWKKTRAKKTQCAQGHPKILSPPKYAVYPKYVFITRLSRT